MLVAGDYEVRRAVWGMEMVRRMNFTVPIRTENSRVESVKPTVMVKKGVSILSISAEVGKWGNRHRIKMEERRLELLCVCLLTSKGKEVEDSGVKCSILSRGTLHSDLVGPTRKIWSNKMRSRQTQSTCFNSKAL